MRAIAVVTLLWMGACAAARQEAQPKETTRVTAERDALGLQKVLDTKAPTWLKQHDVPSVAVAFIAHGQVAWTTVHGEQSAHSA